jgi:hypothetical protein
MPAALRRCFVVVRGMMEQATPFLGVAHHPSPPPFPSFMPCLIYVLTRPSSQRPVQLRTEVDTVTLRAETAEMVVKERE